MPDMQPERPAARAEPASAPRGRHVLVIGASAHGLALASHLLRREARAQVTLIEADAARCRRLRRGEYAALLAQETGPLPAELVAALHRQAGRLHVAETACLSVALTRQGVAARTAEGTTYLGRAAVLALRLGPPAGGASPLLRDLARHGLVVAAGDGSMIAPGAEDRLFCVPPDAPASLPGLDAACARLAGRVALADPAARVGQA